MKKFSLFLFAILLLSSVRLLAQPYLVGHTTITYTDPARSSRSIPTELYYPANTAGTGVPVATGSFPIIVFGHGFVMSWDAYQNIWEDLVPQGYILAFPKTETGFSPVHAELGKDLAFLVTKLQSESATNSSSPFYLHVNSKSAIMGHSMGGGSSFLAGASNTTITTMVTLAAANTTPSSITAASLVTVPNLVLSGQNDCVAPASAHQQPMYDSLASACKAFVSINGGAHCEFANYNFNCAFGESTCTPAPGITRTEQQDVAGDFMKLWLAYYLKDDCAAWTSFNDSLSVSTRISHQATCNINNPVISAVGMNLSSTPATTYQWYLNGNPIGGATSQNYTATAAGTYQVMVTYYNSCLYPSNSIVLSSTGIDADQQEVGFSLAPNPVEDQLHIEYAYSGSSEMVLSIYNLLGEQVMSMPVAGGTHSLQVDLSSLSSGVYVTTLSVGRKVLHQKFVKK